MLRDFVLDFACENHETNLAFDLPSPLNQQRGTSAETAMEIKTNETQASRTIKTPRRRRWIRILAVLLALAVSIPCWWWLSAPIEPGEEATVAWYAWVPRKLKTLAVNAIGEQIRHYIREKVEAETFKTDLDAQQMTARLRDENADPAERRKDAYRLAKTGAPENIATVQSFLQTAETDDKAAIAQLLGLTDSPQNRALLWSLLDDSNVQVNCAALRGLSMLGGEDVMQRLAQYLNSENRPLALRTEAAAGLANIGTPAAFNTLAQAFTTDGDEELASAVLQALSTFRFEAESERIFRTALSAKELPLDVRVNAIEALSDCPAGAAGFLVEIASGAAEWEIRAGAAWGLSKLDAMPGGSGTLLKIAEKERDEVVRRRLYEAMQVHSDVAPERVFEMAAAEKDLSARVAGFNTAGILARNNPEIAARFNATAVDEMARVALSEASENLRIRAVFALRRAGTGPAIDALRRIGQSATGNVARAAQNGI